MVGLGRIPAGLTMVRTGQCGYAPAALQPLSLYSMPFCVRLMPAALVLMLERQYAHVSSESIYITGLASPYNVRLS